jgi:hypothetical protein
LYAARETIFARRSFLLHLHFAIESRMNTLPSSPTLTTVPIPPCRDPFINTPLISLGANSAGVERFWISTWNSNVGAQGLLVDETGNERIYRFEPPYCGFYSAVAQDDDTLWLCGDLSRVVRLSLDSGEYRTFETGAPSALVFQGMALDRQTNKLFALAHAAPRTTAFSFDTATLQTACIYHDIYEASGVVPEAQAHTSRFSFPNGDGTYSLLATIPGATLVRWDPQRETLDARRLDALCPDAWNKQRAAVERYYHSDLSLIADERGHYYFPYLGWYDPLWQTMATGPRPEREMNWFARHDACCWGSRSDTNSCDIALWNLKSGAVQDLCSLPDHHNSGFCLGKSQKIMSVSVYGDYRCHDAQSGALEMSRRFATDAVGAVDCLCRIDEERLLGTTFITQRFWEANLASGAGYDCGRAASGVGEVLLTWNINQKIYLASYTRGELTEYDPSVHPHFPENPRLVAKPPLGMRPTTGTRRGGVLYYSCSHLHGHLGCVLTRYDTGTGTAFYRDDPFPDLYINTLHYDAMSDALIAGSTIHAESHSCPPQAEQCALMVIDEKSLEVVKIETVEAGFWQAAVYGKLDDHSYLLELSHEDGSTQWHRMDARTLEYSVLRHEALDDPHLQYIKATGKTGLYIWKVRDRFELWEMRRMEKLGVLCERSDVQRCFVQDDTVYFTTAREIRILENCLKEWSGKHRWESYGKSE